MMKTSPAFRATIPASTPTAPHIPLSTSLRIHPRCIPHTPYLVTERILPSPDSAPPEPLREENKKGAAKGPSPHNNNLSHSEARPSNCLARKIPTRLHRGQGSCQAALSRFPGMMCAQRFFSSCPLYEVVSVVGAPLHNTGTPFVKTYCNCSPAWQFGCHART